MNTSAPSLSPFSARQVHLSQTPMVTTGTAILPEKPSPIVERAPRAHFNLDYLHALVVRICVVAIGWAFLGVYCALVFSAFCNH